MVVTNQRREAAIPQLALVVSAIVAVQRGSMNIPGGDQKQRRQRAQSDARERGTVVVVVVVASGLFYFYNVGPSNERTG